MLILLVEPAKAPVVREINGSPEEMQSIVGGPIRAVYPFADDAALICNDDGNLLGLPLNRCLRDERKKASDIICGTFIICGVAEGEFVSLTPAQTDRYMDCFRTPEMFVGLGNQILCMPLREDPDCWYRPKSGRRTGEKKEPTYIVFPSDPNAAPKEFDTYPKARAYGEEQFGNGNYTIESPI